MRTRWLLATLSSLVATSLAPEARAQAHGFADKSHLILTADRLVPLLSVERTSTEFQQGNATVTDSTSRTSTVLLLSNPLDRLTVHTLPRVAADFTVIDHLTVGGFFAFGLGLGGSNDREVVNGATTTQRSEDAGSGTVIGLGPRVGYILPFHDVLAVWLRGGFSFYSVSNRNYDDDNNNRIRVTSSITSFSIDIDPQLAIVPMEHFYFSVGPVLNIPIAGSRKVETVAGNTSTTTTNDFSQFHVGVNASLGGWFSF